MICNPLWPDNMSVFFSSYFFFSYSSSSSVFFVFLFFLLLHLLVSYLSTYSPNITGNFISRNNKKLAGEMRERNNWQPGKTDNSVKNMLYKHPSNTQNVQSTHSTFLPEVMLCLAHPVPSTLFLSRPGVKLGWRCTRRMTNMIHFHVCFSLFNSFIISS